MLFAINHTIERETIFPVRDTIELNTFKTNVVRLFQVWFKFFVLFYNFGHLTEHRPAPNEGALAIPKELVSYIGM